MASKTVLHSREIPVANNRKVYIGGWFQRTTLHLSETYDFLKDGESPLALDREKLQSLRDGLGLDRVEMQPARLDFIQAETTGGISIRIYEDGLMVLAKERGAVVRDDVSALTSYYEDRLSPAINYIFSLGAPVPKELANIATIYPYFVVLHKASEGVVKDILDEFKEREYFEVRRREFEIYRGNKLYVINNIAEDPERIERFIDEQIFIREFKGQLHRYLNLHRIIWEEIADVKEKGEIRGDEVGVFKARIESYAKTINLIDARINQMGSYLRTRESAMKSDEGMAKFVGVLEFKHETLADTHAYIKDLWAMTRNYVGSALDLFGGIQAKSTESSVKNLSIITSIGVGATIIGLFTQQPPKINMLGLGYFTILAVVGYVTDRIMKRIYARRM